MLDLTRWQDLMQLWGFEQNTSTFDELNRAYTESHRFYHTTEHVNACLGHHRAYQKLMNYPQEVELALWFHDAVYKPFANNNEQASADWAARFLDEQGAEGDSIQRVYSLIMITEHNAKPSNRDQAVLVDIDLSILGSPREIYDQFERNVRHEYKKVPWFIYRRKRQQLLKEFLGREQLYTSGCFDNEVELQAQVNLSRAIAQLDASSEGSLAAQ